MHPPQAHKPRLPGRQRVNMSNSWRTTTKSILAAQLQLVHFSYAGHVLRTRGFALFARGQRNIAEATQHLGAFQTWSRSCLPAQAHNVANVPCYQVAQPGARRAHPRATRGFCDQAQRQPGFKVLISFVAEATCLAACVSSTLGVARPGFRWHKCAPNTPTGV